MLVVGTKLHNRKDGRTITITEIDEFDKYLPYEVEYVKEYDINGEPVFVKEWFPEFVINWWFGNPNVEKMK